jgi:branched-chain amino acid transport system permease protein
MLDVQILIGGLLQGSVFALVGLGISLVYRVTGTINLAQGAFCVLGAMMMYQFQLGFAWVAPLAFALSILCTVALSAIIGRWTFVPAVQRLPESSMLMVTAGLLTFLQGLVLVMWGSQPYALPPFSGEYPVNVLGVLIPSQGLWVAGVTFLVVLSMWGLFYRTVWGSALRACSEDPLAARLMGIDVPWMILTSFVLAAIIGAICGMVIAPLNSIQYDVAGFFSVSGFLGATLGGIGSFVGSIAGGLVLGVAEQFAAGYISSLFSSTMALVVLLAVLLWRPAGILRPRTERRSDVRFDIQPERPVIPFQGVGALVFSGALLALMAALPWVSLPAGVLSSLTIALTLAIAVIGLDVLMGYSGQVSLGQAGFMALGGYSAGVMTATYNLPSLVGVAVGIGLSLVVAALLFLVTRQLRGHYLALATLAFGLLIDSITVGLTEVTGGPSGLVGIPSLATGSMVFDSPVRIYYLVLVVVTVLLVLLFGCTQMSFGRALKAVRSDQLAAAALGVKITRVKLIAFLISAATASIAGSLYAFQFNFLSPEMVGTSRSFALIAMLIIGGEGTLIGGVFGAVMLTLLPTLIQAFASYIVVVEGALLVACFLYLPEGFFGRLAIWISRGQTRVVADDRASGLRQP